ncbi:hypothetical protein Q8A67_018177 [Cirrhinus molitorella]|uniref:Uncharacterized protein n=1 Tax=Cirrhinus molitorella TaxID=172907 RepID=A0AA88PFK9_9TELE|nr:hypothetical protein Q8A67_018177 [Cirrhinus molitorella]
MQGRVSSPAPEETITTRRQRMSISLRAHYSSSYEHVLSSHLQQGSHTSISEADGTDPGTQMLPGKLSVLSSKHLATISDHLAVMCSTLVSLNEAFHPTFLCVNARKTPAVFKSDSAARLRMRQKRDRRTRPHREERVWDRSISSTFKESVTQNVPVGGDRGDRGCFSILTPHIRSDGPVFSPLLLLFLSSPPVCFSVSAECGLTVEQSF